MTTNHVRHLLMGGQACVLYGAAEFSRDTDVAIVADETNLARLRAALDELQAEAIAVPPLDRRYLEIGHAVHFRCHAPDAACMRLDVMSKMRGVEPFDELWRRRTTVVDEMGEEIQLLDLNDLVQAKKTQREKDWPMIKALVARHYSDNRDSATAEQVAFWLRELRTPQFLIQIAQDNAAACEDALPKRPLLAFAAAGDLDGLEQQLLAEQQRERIADAEYWRPLRADLEQLRRERRRAE